MTGSPRQNRVTPYGDLVATPERGLVYGNRGCLHDADGRIRRRYNGKRWIACRLEFKGWRRKSLMQPGKFTELFFLDEATAFAAGHRPCALCRRAEYEAFRRLWAGGQGALPSADEMDAVLHEERVDPGTRGQRRHATALGSLPDGCCVEHRGSPHVVLGDSLLPWSPGGYGSPVPRPAGSTVDMLTPPSLARVLRAGWRPDVPLLHPSAVAARR